MIRSLLLTSLILGLFIALLTAFPALAVVVFGLCIVACVALLVYAVVKPMIY